MKTGLRKRKPRSKTMKAELTMEEEIWLMEEILERQPQLHLTPITPTTTSAITLLAPTTPKKKPNVRIRESLTLQSRIHWLNEPYDPAHPGFKRPAKRLIIRPASAAMTKATTVRKTTKPGFSKPSKRPLIRPASAATMVGIRKATRPGPLITSGPRLATKAQEHQSSSQLTATRGANDTETAQPHANEPVFPSEAAASFIKRKRRIGRWRESEKTSNPGLLNE
ncbi:hypothetical protein KQX54_014228 [Cotesia glomerata]|uniref:Uncharacterized protein n=1 Tax=Cotesia glomerata TaxID=32391 RepID=A0AAV7IFE0_COTGL|nr:hypothetical protein KQX54_014228 [Cotesia glomerata]